MLSFRFVSLFHFNLFKHFFLLLSDQKTEKWALFGSTLSLEASWPSWTATLQRNTTSTSKSRIFPLISTCLIPLKCTELILSLVLLTLDAIYPYKQVFPHSSLCRVLELVIRSLNILTKIVFFYYNKEKPHTDVYYFLHGKPS